MVSRKDILKRVLFFHPRRGDALAPFSMASAMPSSAAAVEGLEEGDALDVSSLSLSLAFLREDMFKMSSSGFVLQKVWGLCRKLEPSRICVTLKTKSV